MEYLYLFVKKYLILTIGFLANLSQNGLRASEIPFIFKILASFRISSV